MCSQPTSGSARTTWAAEHSIVQSQRTRRQIEIHSSARFICGVTIGAGLHLASPLGHSRVLDELLVASKDAWFMAPCCACMMHAAWTMGVGFASSEPP